MVYEFAYTIHQACNGERCEQSGRIVAHDVVIHSWGRNCDSASCACCGRSVQVVDVAIGEGCYAQPGDKVIAG